MAPFEQVLHNNESNSQKCSRMIRMTSESVTEAHCVLATAHALTRANKSETAVCVCFLV